MSPECASPRFSVLGLFVPLLVLFAAVCPEARADQKVTIHSGNGTLGLQDTQVRVLRYGTQGNITPTAANFLTAQTAQFAWIEPRGCPCYIYPLPSDPTAQWLGTTPGFAPESALYAVPFQVTDQVILSATLDLPYSVDNAINGVFINGTRISGNSFDGDYHSEFRFVRNDIGPLLRPNSTNWLYLNVADYGGIAGLIFSATITTNGIGANTLRISPDRGGNVGKVTVSVNGSGFQSGAQLKLTGIGPNIIGSGTTLVNANTLTSTLDLGNAQPGVRDVVITNPDGSSLTLPGAFTIEQGGGPQIWLDIIGPERFRVGREQTFYLSYGNRGNVDVYDNVLLVHVPSGLPVSVTNLLPPAAPANPSISIGSETIVPVWIYALPAGSSGYVVLNLTVPPGAASNGTISASLTMPPPSPFASTGDFTFVPSTATLLATSIVTTLHGPRPGTVAPLTTSSLEVGKVDHSAPITAAANDTCPEQLLYTDAQAWQDCVNRYQQSVINTLKSIQNINNPASYGQGTTLNILENLQPPIGPGASIIGAIMTFFQLRSLQNIANTVFENRVYQPVTSVDPNDKFGPQGTGALRYIPGATPMSYEIAFENKPTASAPAQDVVITDNLDILKLDLATFSLGPISFGSTQVIPPSGLSAYTANVDLRPLQNLIVKLSVALNKVTGIVVWQFASIDPATGLPPADPLAGFLPPGIGGSVFFSVRSASGLATGTPIQNSALIVFDVNAPISTPVWLNTIDNTKPTSHVSPLPSTQNSATFTVQWTGTDVGAGIQDFTIYYSDNGGPFTAGQPSTATSATFTGQLGHTYRFYSIARDLTGNIENSKTLAEAATTIVDTAPPLITGMPTSGCSIWPPDKKLAQIANVTASDALSGLAPNSLTVTVTSNEQVKPGDIVISNGIVRVIADRDGNGNGRIYTVQARAADLAGNIATATGTCTVPHDEGK